MVDKIILVSLFALLGIFVGKIASKSIKTKCDYLIDLVDLCESLLSDIKFTKNGIRYVFENFNYKSDDLKNNVKSYLKTKKFISSIKFNSKNKQIIEEVFNCLGTYDDIRQYELLLDKKETLDKVAKESKEKLSKEYSAFIKLGFLGGLCVGVLMI